MTKSLVYLYLILINLITFLAFYIDKRRAIARKWRIPEGMLFLLSFLGGSIGAHMSMHLFHHKNRKPIFRLGIPLIMLLNLAIFGYVLFLR